MSTEPSWDSDNDGKTWEQIGKIDITSFKKADSWSMTRLEDGTLLLPIQSSEARISEDWSTVISGKNTLYASRSKDGGRTFPYRSILGDWCSVETNIAALPSSKLLVVIRYQRPRLPGNPPDLFERTGTATFRSLFPYKHVFLADSADDGLTWRNLRQLTTVFGQCFGSAVGLSEDRVVVVHDHRYPRELASGRAMVSLDGGQTWEDEVYYLCHGSAASYAFTITLNGEEMLIFVGSYTGPLEKKLMIGKTRFVLIRWRLV